MSEFTLFKVMGDTVMEFEKGSELFIFGMRFFFFAEFEVV